MNFNPQAFVDNLSYMGEGMLGILIVIGVFILVTAGMNRVFRK